MAKSSSSSLSSWSSSLSSWSELQQQTQQLQLQLQQPFQHLQSMQPQPKLQQQQPHHHQQQNQMYYQQQMDASQFEICQMKRPITGIQHFSQHQSLCGARNQNQNQHHHHQQQRNQNQMSMKAPFFSSNMNNTATKSTIPFVTNFSSNQNFNPTAKFSRKVFIGGLPPDIDESNERILPGFHLFS